MEKYMPWLVALFIGTLSAVINVYIGYRLRKSNESNLQKQIDNSKEIAITQFKATIATKNRQEWLNELRNALSEFLSISAQLSNDVGDIDYTRKYLERLTHTKFRIELVLTNPQKKEQQELLLAVEDLVRFLGKQHTDKTKTYKNFVDEILRASRELLTIHWNKIKELK